MKTVLALLLFVLPALAFADVTVGMSEAALLALKGKPVGKTVAGAKSIYHWADMEVNLQDGKVVNVVVRDETKEQAMEAQRQKNIKDAIEQKKAMAAREAAVRAAAAEHTRISDQKVSDQLNQEAAREAERQQKEQADKAAAEERSRMRPYRS